MLRYSFLPSDYHPMVLMLGETPDLIVLSRVLRQFGSVAHDVSNDVDLGEFEGFELSDTRIVLTHNAERLGMYPVSLKEKSFRWSLDQSFAEYFADLVDELAEPSRKSGSERLVCGHYEEIPVRVSRGEFTDDYLLDGRHERRLTRL